MDRRHLIRTLIAAALAGPVVRADSSRPLRVVVAGAGIIGAAIAFHLSKAGAAVTVIDQEGPATHASRGTFAWVNASWPKQPRHYHALSQQGVATWRDLQRDLKIPVRWGGSLEWFDDAKRRARLAEQIDAQQQWGEPARMIDAAGVAELEPNLRFPSDWQAAYSANDGALDPVVATHRLLDAAVAAGASLQYPCTLERTVVEGNRLTQVVTCRGAMEADRLVLATGANTMLPAKIAGIDIPQRITPGVIALTKPVPRLIHRIVVAPGVHLHQRDDGRIVLGEQAGPPNNRAHKRRLKRRPNDFPSAKLARKHGRRIRAIAEAVLPDIADAEIETAYIGWRPQPVDGHPVLGPSPVRPDVYLAIMHSGVSLAPIVGQLVAQEVLGAKRLDQLAPYRPDRTFDSSKQ